MITINELLEKNILGKPFLEEGIAQGIINLSALSRKLQPQIEEQLMHPVSTSAILMALNRLLPKLRRNRETSMVGLKTGDITVRSGLSEFTYARSVTFLEKKMQLLNAVKSTGDHFMTTTQGVQESTTIVNTTLEEKVEEAFKGERLLKKIQNLAAITIRLTEESVYQPGVHYNILKQLAWHNINVVEVVSTYSEFHIILHKSQVDTSFSIMLRYLAP